MIYCFGDSHVSFFSGRELIQPIAPEPSDDLLPFFRTFHVGPALAYNLVQEGTLTRGREKILATLEDQVPKKSRVLLCFGEIDCRSHLLGQVWKQKIHPDQIARACAERYIRFATELQGRGYDLIVYNAIPTSYQNTGRNQWDKVPYPYLGNHRERNEITNAFNRSLEQFCRDRKIRFLHNYPHLVNSTGETREEFYMDRIHLSQRAQPLTLRCLEEIFPGEKFVPPPEWELPRLRRVFSFRWPFIYYKSARKKAGLMKA